LKYAYVIENEHMCYWNVHKTIVIMSKLKFMGRIWQACTNMTYTCTILGIQTDALFSYFLSQNSATTTTINLWPFAQYIKKYLILIRGCNKKEYRFHLFISMVQQLTIILLIQTDTLFLLPVPESNCNNKVNLWP
jgi:hypothetical protein